MIQDDVFISSLRLSRGDAEKLESIAAHLERDQGAAAARVPGRNYSRPRAIRYMIRKVYEELGLARAPEGSGG